MTNYDVMKLALEALEFNCVMSEDGEDLTPRKIKKAITALREALANQPAQQDRLEELLEIFKDVDQIGPLLGMGRPTPPSECQTDAEKTAFAFGWWKALEHIRMKKCNQYSDIVSDGGMDPRK